MASLTNLLTPWGEELDHENPLNDYPRPQLERSHWICLNGQWDYAINKDMSSLPTHFDGKITVPFSPECELSGVHRGLKPDEVLWYRTVANFDDKGDNRVLLHFGAVDQIATVYVNGQKVGTHKGGYWPFSFDVAAYLKDGDNEIVVRVRDYSDQGENAYGDFAFGKQRTKRGGIWYTPQSGIWQTVWAEYVPQKFILALKLTPKYDESAIDIKIKSNVPDGTKFDVKVLDGDKVVAKTTTKDRAIVLDLPEFKSWSPDSPFLYDLVIKAGDDEVKSYFGMRKFSLVTDEDGMERLGLNNKPIFHNGLLDQGYWSDGMYTPPSDDAMVWELQKLKDMGFNMLRKHIKVEPLRWYYHCDRLGMLVWQDFINGGGPYNPAIIQVLPFLGLFLDDRQSGLFARGDESGRDRFETQELPDTMDVLYNCVSLSVWVPFNEGWGQFDSTRIGELVRRKDPTRLIDFVSGWHDQGKGDFNSPHVYFKPFKMKEDKWNRVQILSEFGGYSSPTDGHMASSKVFGYKIVKGHDNLTDEYIKLYEKQIIPEIAHGLSATVYTQVSDVEDEINGVFTYDRKVVKLDEDRIRALNEKVKI